MKKSSAVPFERRTRRVRSADTHDVHDGSAVSQVYRRLDTAESEITVIREQIVGVSSQLSHQGDQLNSIVSKFDTLTAVFQARSVTDWKTLAAWAGVILSMVILYTGLVITPVREGLSQSRSDINDNAAKLAAMDRQYVEDLKQRLQKEIEEAEKRGLRQGKIEALEREVYSRK